MSEVYTWDITAANNNAAPPDGWPENTMQYSQVNDAAREMMAAIARQLADTNGTLVTGGSSNAFTITLARALPDYFAGLTIVIQADRANTGPATLNVNNLGAKAIQDVAGSALRWADIRQNGIYTLLYNGTAFQAINIDTSKDWTGKIDQHSGSLASIPAGWRLCNGSNGTINLIDRMVICAGGSYNVGATGGAATATTASAGGHAHSTDSAGHHGHYLAINAATLSTSQIPSHEHAKTKAAVGGSSTVFIGDFAVWGDVNAGNITVFSGFAGGGGAHSHSGITDGAGTHAHNTTTAGSHQHTVSTLSPYYALAFIQRVATQ